MSVVSDLFFPASMIHELTVNNNSNDFSASYILFHQAPLSHYGGGKSSSIEVGIILIPPLLPFFFGFRAWYETPPQSQTVTLIFIFLLCLVYSVHYIIVFLPSAWVYRMHGCLLFSRKM